MYTGSLRIILCQATMDWTITNVRRNRANITCNYSSQLYCVNVIIQETANCSLHVYLQVSYTRILGRNAETKINLFFYKVT